MNTTETASYLKPYIPRWRTNQIVVASSDYTEKQYLAFPSVLRANEREILISFKRGHSHALDAGADLQMVRFDTIENKTIDEQTIGHIDGLIMQMGEWVRFPNGDIASYVDLHIAGVKKIVYRTGMFGCRSVDDGKTFGPMERVGLVDGIEYGYPFEHIVKDGSVYLLVMTFEYLAGRKGSVDVVRSDDNGVSWHFVRDLSHEFGDVPINETTFVPYGDGFLISTRGYDARQRLHRVDHSFGLIAETDLTETYTFIDRQIGRPRIFEKDGAYYLMGRNYTESGDSRMKQCLFRVNPETLTVDSWVVLDNHEEGAVVDGYYPVCYWQRRDGSELFNVIDYKSVVDRYPGPDIVRHEYDWQELVQGLDSTSK